MLSARDDGIAVPLVLMIVAMLATFGTLLAHLSTTRLQLTAINTEAIENGLLADGIVQVAAASIFDAGDDLRILRTPEICSVGDRNVRIAAYATRGLLDLNAAPPERMFALFKGFGVEESLARRLTDSVIDFRDVDDEKIGGGSEREAYADAGLPFAPKNAPFEAVEELDQVLGMSPEIFAEVMPYLTVFSRSPDWSPDLAPARLRSALGVTEKNLASGGLSTSSIVRSMKVWVAVSRPGRPGEIRSADIESVPVGNRRFSIKGWSRGVAAPTPDSIDALAAPCPDVIVHP